MMSRWETTRSRKVGLSLEAIVVAEGILADSGRLWQTSVSVVITSPVLPYYRLRIRHCLRHVSHVTEISLA